MAGLLMFKPLQDFLGGGQQPPQPSAVPADADFADFATAASPAAPSHAASSEFSGAATTAKPAAAGLFGAGTGLAGRPYTKWYRVWERVTIADFYQELVIIPIIIVIIIVNMIGASMNKKKAKQFAETYYPLLESEFARVGFPFKKKGGIQKPEDMFEHKSKNEYTTYCTGRQNVAFLDLKLTLYKRYNPLILAGEAAASFFVESIPPPVEKIEATAYAFDGKEKSLVPAKAQGAGAATPNSKDSTYDGFVWAVVHKDKMKQLRDDRYDLSLTSTKDHPKLPAWATVMSESAEVTEAMLTPDLLKALNDAGEDLEALIVSDQPIDAPKKLNDVVQKKRVSLHMRVSDNANSVALFTYFLRMPDYLVNSAHFRAEALRKVKATREEEIRKLRKVDEDEKAEERRTNAEKLKKEERDRKLSKLSAEEQRKFLEKEKEKNQRKSMKKQTMRG